MGRKEILKRRQARYMAKRKALLERSKESQDVNEVREINEQLDDIAAELQDIADELKAIAEEDKGNGNGDGNGDGNGSENGTGNEGEEGRSAACGSETRNANIIGSYVQNPAQNRRNENVLASMEYRQAFATFFRTGDASQINALEERAKSDGMIITTDVGKVIPQTIMDELIKDLKVYGQLYNKVRKLNVKGGVEFPIEELVPTVRWIGETEVSDNQVAPDIKKSVSFGYYVAEARISQSLLSSVVSLPVLESEIARILAEAFIKEFDRMIVAGTGSGQPTGILTDTRVGADHKLTFTETEMADWATWRTKLFSTIPLAYRGQGVLVMTASTWESQIMTMKDNNNRPLYSETYDPATGDVTCRFAGREVILVEPDILKDFGSAANGDAFAIYFKPTDYAINSNLQVGFKRYFNDDTNKWVNKGLTICDGKLLDVNGVYILTKSTAAKSTAAKSNPVG